MKLKLLKRPQILLRNNDTVNVFYACDDHYVKFMSVSVISLIKHASQKREYAIHILHTDISERNMALLSSLSTENVSISFHDVSEQLAKLKNNLALRDYYTSTTYFRFFIADMFPRIDKAIYIDGDTTVIGDVADLYRYNLGDNLVGAVPEMVMRYQDIYGTYAEKVLNISRAAYFNAGVMLINCAGFRREHIYRQFIELMNTYTFVVTQDEDYLNILCQNRILWVDTRWNAQITEPITRTKDQMSIIHYSLAQKPWHYENGKYSEYYWEAAKDSPYLSELRKELENFGEEGRKRDAAYGENLFNITVNEISSEHNYRQAIIPDVHRSLTRQDIIEKIARYELEGRFDEDVEDDPPGRTLMPNEIDYLRKDIKSRLRTRYAFRIARWFMNTMINKHQLIIKEIRGIENYRHLSSGAVITCNHFNAMDSFAMEIAYRKSRQYARRFFRVIREGNYTSFPGFYGFLMRNCNTLPLSSNPTTMKKFLKSVNRLLQKGHFILVYPEQSMWWNYKKPKPLKRGAFSFAAEANVPVLPCFITMEDSPYPGEGGFPVQEYTIHVLNPIYPKDGLTKAENTRYLMEENARVWKEIYESTYGVPLSYTTVEKSE